MSGASRAPTSTPVSEIARLGIRDGFFHDVLKLRQRSFKTS
jgi:hypothetical protein